MDRNDIAFFAKTNFRQQDRAFGIKTDDRRRHMYVIGKTGMGKTNLLENLAIQDIHHGHGIAFIDPHGDTAEKLIQAIPSNRINDVVYFNPSDQDFPIAFNIMERVDVKYRPLVASGLIGVFKKLWADSWGPRLEYILRNAILALLEYPGSTLLGVNRLLVDKDYRKKVIDQVTDPVVRSFWVDEFTKWNDRVLQEVVSPIQNKVGQFLSNPLIRNVIGQTHTSFDIREIMDQRKILVMNLSKGRIGEDISGLLGALMITKIQLAAMSRVDIPEEDRNDFYLYVDEFQNFATESFANILSEARKYRLNLIVANQYISQLSEEVRDAIFGNAGTIISFRVGAADAEYLEKEFEPVFMMNDIVNLPKYHIYLKLMIDGIAGDAFSATALPPIDIEPTIKNADTIIRTSRERYASDRTDVEEKIRRWSGMMSEAERQAIYNIKPPVAPPQYPVSGAEPRVFPPAPIRQPRPVQRPVPSRAAAPVPSEPRPAAPIAPPTPAPAAPAPRADMPSVSVSRTAVEPPQVQVSVETEKVVPPVSDVGTMSERATYTAQCSVCHETIEVPFQPDGKRPTFCKEYLKEYQRLTAKSRAESVSVSSPAPDLRPMSESPRDVSLNPSAGRPERVAQPKTFVPEERPLSLYQMQHVAPKKFRRGRDGKPELELSAIRDLIQGSHPKE